MMFAYFATLAWQLIWIGMLPPPAGPRNLWLAGFACLPLLIPITGLLRQRLDQIGSGVSSGSGDVRDTVWHRCGAHHRDSRHTRSLSWV